MGFFLSPLSLGGVCLKKYLLILCFVLFFSSVNIGRVHANPAVALLGAEGLALLQGLAVKQGLRFASAQAARVFFSSAVKRTPAVLSNMTNMTRSVVTVGGGKALRYTLSGAGAAALMAGMAEYAGEVQSLPYTDGVTFLDYYDAWDGTSEYFGTSKWYAVPYSPYATDHGWQTSGINFHYIDSLDGMWKVFGLTTTNSILGSHRISLTSLDSLNVKVVINYLTATGSWRTTERIFPLGDATVAVGDPVVLQYPFPLDGVVVGEPRAIPIPLTGEFDIYIPLPLDTVHDVLEANPEFVDTPIDVPIDPPVPGTPPWTNPDTARINFAPLQVAGEMLTNKFPFSIPWDIKRQLSIFDITPQTPEFDVNIKVPIFSTDYDMKFRIDFSMFDGLAAMVRWFLIIAFDVALILSLRKFFPE